MTLSVLRAGFFTTVQDRGRRGFQSVGVSLGGALDRHAMRVANILAGNEEGAAGLEITMGKVRLRFADQRVVSWCGGAFDVQLNDRPLPPGRPGLIDAGEELRIIAPEAAGRAWLAIAGGIDVPVVLGSRATDVRAHFGGLNGRALRDGDNLSLGKPSLTATRLAALLREQRIAEWGVQSDWAGSMARIGFLRVVPGAHWNQFSLEHRRQFYRASFSVMPESDRMGLRLEGTKMERMDQRSLQSEAVAPGTIQVPPAGDPILLLGDCQTLGGYPKIAHVITVDLSIAAQLRPGDPVRFQEISLGEAHRLLIERERDLARFRTGMQLRI